MINPSDVILLTQAIANVGGSPARPISTQQELAILRIIKALADDALAAQNQPSPAKTP